MVRYRVNAGLVRNLRRLAGKSQLQMAIEADIQTAIISNIETGRSINPTVDSVKKIAQYFNISMDDLMIQE